MNTSIISEWKELYFQEVHFPIVIFKSDDYLGVSDIYEYYYDIDINIWYVNEDCDLIDSKGNKYNFKKINKKQWVPDKKIGVVKLKAVKERIRPMLYMPPHKKGLDKASNLVELMDLIISE